MKNKVKLISFSIVFILLASLIIPKAYALYQGKSLMREGDNLLASNQYQPALEKYQQSKEKWENKNINEKIEKECFDAFQGLEYEINTWQKNKYKWAYAQEWCKNRDIKFWLITETHLSSFKP